MEDDRHRVEADGLDRLVDGDLVAINREAVLGHDLGEVTGGDRTVEHAGLAGLAQDDEALAVQLLANGLGFLAALEVAGLELGALRVDVLLVGFGGAQSLATRQEEVAGIAGTDLHGLADRKG